MKKSCLWFLFFLSLAVVSAQDVIISEAILSTSQGCLDTHTAGNTFTLDGVEYIHCSKKVSQLHAGGLAITNSKFHKWAQDKPNCESLNLPGTVQTQGVFTDDAGSQIHFCVWQNLVTAGDEVVVDANIGFDCGNLEETELNVFLIDGEPFHHCVSKATYGGPDANPDPGTSGDEPGSLDTCEAYERFRLTGIDDTCLYSLPQAELQQAQDAILIASEADVVCAQQIECRCTGLGELGGWECDGFSRKVLECAPFSGSFVGLRQECSYKIDHAKGAYLEGEEADALLVGGEDCASRVNCQCVGGGEFGGWDCDFDWAQAEENPCRISDENALVYWVDPRSDDQSSLVVEGNKRNANVTDRSAYAVLNLNSYDACVNEKVTFEVRQDLNLLDEVKIYLGFGKDQLFGRSEVEILGIESQGHKRFLAVYDWKLPSYKEEEYFFTVNYTRDNYSVELKSDSLSVVEPVVSKETATRKVGVEVVDGKTGDGIEGVEISWELDNPANKWNGSVFEETSVTTPGSGAVLLPTELEVGKYYRFTLSKKEGYLTKKEEFRKIPPQDEDDVYEIRFKLQEGADQKIVYSARHKMEPTGDRYSMCPSDEFLVGTDNPGKLCAKFYLQTATEDGLKKQRINWGGYRILPRSADSTCPNGYALVGYYAGGFRVKPELYCKEMLVETDKEDVVLYYGNSQRMQDVCRSDPGHVAIGAPSSPAYNVRCAGVLLPGEEPEVLDEEISSASASSSIPNSLVEFIFKGVEIVANWLIDRLFGSR